MPLTPKLAANDTPTSANLNAVGAGTVTGCTSITMSRVKRGTLSALVTLDAETDTIALAAFWQVSNDDATFYTVVQNEFASQKVWCIGTAGADASVSRVVQAPDAVYGWPFARIAVTNSVTTGAAADTYVCGYYFEKELVA